MENNLPENQEMTNENEAQQELILGKFKNVDELAKAYQNMQTQSGQQSKELGELRKKALEYDEIVNSQMELQEKQRIAKEYLDNVVPKYRNDEFFLNPEFNNIFKRAYEMMGAGLNTDELVSMLDAYAQSRIKMHEKSKLAKDENENLKAEMSFSQSPAKKSESTKIPNMSNMSKEEIDALVAKYI